MRTARITNDPEPPPENWPPLPLAAWEDTRATLHMWTQIVGKVRLALTPHVNHWWEVPLYVNARGLTTSPIPYLHGAFEIQFDFIAHKLVIETSRGAVTTVSLVPRTVADFYQEFMAALRSLGIKATIWPLPMEIPDPIRFDRDLQHASYDAQYAHRFWQILVNVEAILQEFRARFIGKNSPVHFFWGSFDMAVTRFSGRRAPERPEADLITREAYSHEVISAGFWPGSGVMQEAAFYTYAAPEPAGLAEQQVRPSTAFYHPELHEFILRYDDVRLAASPKTALLDFLQSTYEAAANLASWNRAELEKPVAKQPGKESAL